MDNPNAVSNLPTYSNALNFNCCQYQYEVPVVNLIEAYDSDDEVDYYDFRNCRIQMEKYAKEVTVLMQKNAHENEKIPHVPKEAISQIQNKEAKIPHVIRKPSTDKIAQNLIMKNSLADKINGNVPKTESSTLVKKSVNATPDLIQDSISVIVSEEVLCLCVDGKIEKYDVRGTVGVSYVTQNNNSDNNDNGIAINVISDSIKEDTNKLRNTTASLQLKFDDTEGILTNIKANSSFITSPVIPDLSKQDLKVDNIQKNSPDKISAIMKYSAISTFQPCYFKARNKMKIQLPNAKILIQIKLNPIYKIFFTNIDSFIVQASFSCFLFDKNSNVILRPCDKFNENTKIVTWVCGTIDLEKEDTIQLECSLEGEQRLFSASTLYQIFSLLLFLFSHQFSFLFLFLFYIYTS